ncbi:copper homeostasis protein CutC [Roseibium sp. SCP14]|uniref:copper homeostasis protein CutC n=1 Tax=Roseibium sp. SCP14 TaxID=3141375 RepID=UPI0033357582
MTAVRLEVCVDTIEGAWIAAENGANRIELCAALSEGGLTPSAGFMTAASRLPIPVFAMIRPRSGDFQYSDAEKALMLRDIQTAEQAGLAGLVIGATTEQRKLDGNFLSTALEGTNLPATLHRAFDTLQDPSEGVEEAISLGFERILTSGQAQRAEQGLDVLEAVVSRAAGRISIMAGSGVTETNAARILRFSAVNELHASCSSSYEPLPATTPEVQLGFTPSQGARLTDASRVQALKMAIDQYLETAE